MILILSAVESEIAEIRKHLRSVKTMEVSGRSFFRGHIGENELVVGTSGVGKVKSAIFMQKLLDTFPCDCVFRLGTAGSFGEIQPMEIAVGDYVTYHDYSAHLLETQYPFVTSFPCDKRAAECLTEFFRAKNVKFRVGKCLSGDCFIESEALASRMREEYQALCVDMESAAVAECAYINAAPFVDVNIITDVVSAKSNSDYHVRCFEASNFLGSRMAEFFDEVNVLRILGKGDAGAE